jgi:hypothetical protein
MAGEPEKGPFGIRLRYGADLTKQRYRVDRQITLAAGESVALVEEWAGDGSHVDLRLFQPQPRSGLYHAVLLDRSRPLGYFTMHNPDFTVLVGYLFRTGDSPWVGDFQENRRMTHKPWNGQAVTRGIEFGTTPFAEGLRRSVERGSLFGAPTYRWIGARERRKVSYGIFLLEIPPGFAGVADVTLDGGRVTVVERNTGRRIAVPAGALGPLRD